MLGREGQPFQHLHALGPAPTDTDRESEMHVTAVFTDQHDSAKGCEHDQDTGGLLKEIHTTKSGSPV